MAISSPSFIIRGSFDCPRICANCNVYLRTRVFYLCINCFSKLVQLGDELLLRLQLVLGQDVSDGNKKGVKICTISPAWDFINCWKKTLNCFQRLSKLMRQFGLTRQLVLILLILLIVIVKDFCRSALRSM